MENYQISHSLWCYSIAIRRILVWSHVWKGEVAERPTLHNLHTNDVLIQSELRHLIGAKVAGTIKCITSPGSTLPKINGFMSGHGTNPTKTENVWYLDGSGTELHRLSGPNLERRQVYWTHCSHYTCHMPHTTHQILLTTRHLTHASWCVPSETQQVSGSSMSEDIWKE